MTNYNLRNKNQPDFIWFRSMNGRLIVRVEMPKPILTKTLFLSNKNGERQCMVTNIVKMMRRD